MIRHDLKVAIDSAAMTLKAAGVPSPLHDAVVLAAHLLAVEPAEVRRLMALGWGDAPDRYDVLVAERARRVPLQHLTGIAYYRGLELAVGPGVFVPRPETEMLVDLVMNHVDALVRADPAYLPVVVDLCTGSGAIAFGVKDEATRAQVYAVEVSPDAYAWAELNRTRLGLDVDLVLADARGALTELDGTVDVVVTNPPYIPPGQIPVDPEVRDHDPEIALYGGGLDGLDVPLAVAARAARLLRPGGLFVMEHAENQRRPVTNALEGCGTWSHVQDLDDLTGRPRCVVARRTPVPAGDVPLDLSVPAATQGPDAAGGPDDSPVAAPSVRDDALAQVIPFPTARARAGTDGSAASMQPDPPLSPDEEDPT